MAEQLHLLDLGSERFRLDEPTKESGRRGIAKARAALRESAQRVAFADPDVNDLHGRPSRPAPGTRAGDDVAHADAA